MRIAIIGGGAAGMMAAATINESNAKAEVFLIEKNNELGKKVIISGGGRCNVTTGIKNIAELIPKYPRGGKFLQASLRRFGPSDVYTWFEKYGVPLECEDDLRVFPVSDNGHDIVNAFKQIFKIYKTKIFLNSGVEEIAKNKDDEKFLIKIKNHEQLAVDRVVLALGGQAYRHTGSTGDGYRLAEKLGHSITALAASLNSFITLEKWPKILAGVSLPNVGLFAKTDKKYYSQSPLLFTHSGISGPAVFALSSQVAFENYSPKKPLNIFLDLVREVEIKKLTDDLARTTALSPKQSFKNALHTFVPLRVAEVICDQLEINHEKKNFEISKKIILSAVDWLKKMPLKAIQRGAGEEFVTAGGVELSEVDPRTMESKICPGLFFAGEILNIDGYTGGFNLQAAWSTGRVAGLNVRL